MRPVCVIDDGGNTKKCQNHIEQKQITHFQTEVARRGQPNRPLDTSSGGVGKSTIICESLLNHLSALANRKEKLPKIVVWPGYEDTLLKLQRGAPPELRDCFKTPGGVSSYHPSGLPFTSSECVDAILREGRINPNDYPEPLERGAKAVDVLLERGEWLFVDGCEFHHDPTNYSNPKTDPILSGVLQKACEPHDRFKALVISRGEVPELRGIPTFFVSLPTNEAITNYLETELEIPVKADFDCLMDAAGGDRRPLLWRAVAEFARTAFEARFRKPWEQCSVKERRSLAPLNRLKLSKEDPLGSCLKAICDLEDHGSENGWVLAYLVGFFNQWVALNQGVTPSCWKVILEALPTDWKRILSSRNAFQDASQRLNRTGLVSLCESNQHGEWILDAHPEVRQAFAHLLNPQDEAISRKQQDWQQNLNWRHVHKSLAKFHFDNAKGFWPKPSEDERNINRPRTMRNEVGDIEDWVVDFSQGVYHRTCLGLHSTAVTFLMEFWERVQGRSAFRLLVNGNFVTEEYEILSQFTERLGAVRPQLDSGSKVQKKAAAICILLQANADWHMGLLGFARDRFAEAANRWEHQRKSAPLVEALRRRSETCGVAGALDDAVEAADQACKVYEQWSTSNEILADSELSGLYPKNLEMFTDCTYARALHFRSTKGDRSLADDLFQKNRGRILEFPENWPAVLWFWMTDLRVDSLRRKFDKEIASGIRQEAEVGRRVLEEMNETDNFVPYDFDLGLYHLGCGILGLAEVEANRNAMSSVVPKHVEDACRDGLKTIKRSNQSPHIALGYLVVGRLERLQGNFAAALTNLIEAERVATRGFVFDHLCWEQVGKKGQHTFWTYLADIYLERLLCACDQGDLVSAQKYADWAEIIICSIRYGRRDLEIAELQENLVRNRSVCHHISEMVNKWTNTSANETQHEELSSLEQPGDGLLRELRQAALDGGADAIVQHLKKRGGLLIVEAARFGRLLAFLEDELVVPLCREIGESLCGTDPVLGSLRHRVAVCCGGLSLFHENPEARQAVSEMLVMWSGDSIIASGLEKLGASIPVDPDDVPSISVADAATQLSLKEPTIHYHVQQGNFNGPVFKDKDGKLLLSQKQLDIFKERKPKMGRPKKSS